VTGDTALVELPEERAAEAAAGAGLPGELVRALGEIAARRADRVVVGEKERYLRGRDRAEMPRLLREGAATVGVTDVPVHPSG
jgi:hypothetical protein